MTHVKNWTVDIAIDEHEDRTRARARLTTEDNTLVGVGLARLNPSDSNIPEIGDELATSRALADLAHKLLDITAADIEMITHKTAHLAR